MVNRLNCDQLVLYWCNNSLYGKKMINKESYTFYKNKVYIDTIKPIFPKIGLERKQYNSNNYIKIVIPVYTNISLF